MNLLPRRKNLRFAQILAGMLLLVLLVSMSSIAVVTSYFTRQSIGELSNSIVRQTLGRLEQRIGTLLDQAQNQNAQAKMLIDGQQIQIEDFEALGAYFSHSLDVLKNLSNLCLGIERNGDFLFAERQRAGFVRVREYVEDETGTRVIRNWRWHGAERELLEVTPWDNYDPRKRPWYQAAEAAGQECWTETYRFWVGNERGPIPGITFATPMPGANGELAGILASDIDLEDLCDFLKEVQDEMSGLPFVLERRRDGSLRLIAHPDPKALPEPEADGEHGIPDPEVAAYVRTRLAGRPRVDNFSHDGAILFSSGGRRYFGSAHELDGAGQPRWIVGVLVPEDDIMGGVYRNDQRAFWIGVASVAAAALLIVWLARRVGGPLRLLTLEAQSIRELDLDGNTDLTSRIDEVAKLAHSMAEMKSSLRSFQKFVPIDVVRDIVSSGEEARLGGQSLPLTVFFSDIANFTTVAEALEPDALVGQIGEYLAAMSEAIQSCGGTVDKFIGDGIMAFWGAPREDAAHAVNACRAALEHQRALERLRAKWKSEGRPELRARVGIHTGTAIVGNIGSAQRLNYTAIGDTVNVASRLEGLNTKFGTEILISAACKEAAGDAIRVRPVGTVPLKGRVEEIAVYELLGMAE